ncbi:MAG: hypothetical protein JXA21_17725 [Anaerolineae bacterium]|nr:hypothetical protein [Anaerolineae bacterium]
MCIKIIRGIPKEAYSQALAQARAQALAEAQWVWHPSLLAALHIVIAEALRESLPDPPPPKRECVWPRFAARETLRALVEQWAIQDATPSAWATRIARTLYITLYHLHSHWENDYQALLALQKDHHEMEKELHRQQAALAAYAEPLPQEQLAEARATLADLTQQLAVLRQELTVARLENRQLKYLIAKQQDELNQRAA